MEKESRLFDAIEFAARAHRGQYRKGTGIPYLIHPLNVARTLIEAGCEEDVVVAGLLHDTVEDTPVTLADIRTQFGEAVAQLVEAASEPDKSDTWENRKRHTIESLEKAPEEVHFLVCADKLDSILTIRNDYERMGESVWKRFNRPKPLQELYYRSLVDTFLKRTPEGERGRLFRDFAGAVSQVFRLPEKCGDDG
jgi:(p)ppGpp synthase/HD superfamily hydrolase